MEKNRIDEILLKNAISLLIGGYLYDTDLSDKNDEYEKLLGVEKILNEMAFDYKKEIEAAEEHI
jgi:hypothetical protein